MVDAADLSLCYLCVLLFNSGKQKDNADQVRKLVALGMGLDMAIKHAVSRKSYWRMCNTPAMLGRLDPNDYDLTPGCRNIGENNKRLGYIS